MAREPGRAASHINQRVSRAASKLNDHTLLLGFLVAAAAGFLAYIAFASTTGPPFQSAYRINVEVPPDRPTEFEGSEQGSAPRSEEHTSELQSPCNVVCRLLLEN